MRAALLVLLALTVSLAADAQTAPDTVRVIVPVEGGVLYYRAGPGRGVVFRRDQPTDSVAQAEAEAATAQAVLDAVAEARTVLAADSAAVAQLVRVEQAARQTRDSLRTRADRMTAAAASGDTYARRETPDLPAMSRPTTDSPRLGAEADRPGAVPVRPSVDPNRPVGVSDPVGLPPVVTVEEVERAFLDTGLFRASRVPFAFGEATLLPEARRVLDAVGGALVRAPSLRVTVDGHTDAISSDAFNLALSQRRAEAVREYLLGRFQIAPDRLVARGFGEREPIATNETDTGRALNRRVEFVVIGGAPLAPIE